MLTAWSTLVIFRRIIFKKFPIWHGGKRSLFVDYFRAAFVTEWIQHLYGHVDLVIRALALNGLRLLDGQAFPYISSSFEPVVQNGCISSAIFRISSLVCRSCSIFSTLDIPLTATTTTTTTTITLLGPARLVLVPYYLLRCFLQI